MNVYILTSNIHTPTGIISRNAAADNRQTAQDIYNDMLDECDELLKQPEMQNFDNFDNVYRIQTDNPDPDNPSQVTVYKDRHHLDDFQIVAEIKILQVPLITKETSTNQTN